MKKNIKVLSIVLCLVIMLAAFSGCTKPDVSPEVVSPTDTNLSEEPTTNDLPEVTWKFSHTGVPSHSYNISAEAMAKYVSDETDGKFKIDVYHSSTLGWEADVLESMQLGTVHLTWAALGPYADFVPAYNMFNLPFIFESSDHMKNVIQNVDFSKLEEASLQNGLRDLGFAGFSFRVPINSMHPINTVDDFVGVTMRTMSAPVHVDSYSSMGANVETTSFAELYSALQLGVVDGAENTYSSLENMKFYEVAKHVTNLPILNNLCVLAASESEYEKLPSEYQEILKEGAKIAIDTYNSIQDKQDEDAIKILEESGVDFTTPDLTSFIDATEGVRQKYLNEMEPWVKELALEFDDYK